MGIPNEIVSQDVPRRDLGSPRIDAHHHLWQYRASEFGWIGEEMAALQRDFLVEDLLRETQSAGVSGTVVVQARESFEETRWLLECARSSPIICGVVGWVQNARRTRNKSAMRTVRSNSPKPSVKP